MEINVVTALSKKVKIAIVVVSKVAAEMLVVTRPLADSQKVQYAIQATRDVAHLNANLRPQALYAVQVLVNVTQRRPALALMAVARQTLLLRMAMTVAMASDVQVDNALVEICSARRSWAVIPKATTPMLATAKPAV